MTDADGVRQALAALDDAFERQDLEAALALCTDDIVFIGSGEGEEAVGRDAIGPMFAALAPHLDGVDFSVLVAWGHAHLVTRRRSDTLRYRLTGVLVRGEDRWLWRVHHGSEPGSW